MRTHLGFVTFVASIPSVAAMSSRASLEHTIFAEIDGFGRAFSQLAFSNGFVVDVGEPALEPLLPHAASVSAATNAQPAIEILRTTRTLLTVCGRKGSPLRSLQQGFEGLDDRRVAIDDQSSGRRRPVDGQRPSQELQKGGERDA